MLSTVLLPGLNYVSMNVVVSVCFVPFFNDVKGAYFFHDLLMRGLCETIYQRVQIKKLNHGLFVVLLRFSDMFSQNKNNKSS